jgi:hypothetical protein
LLIENFLIAIGGGAAGLGIAYAAVRFFSSIPLPSDVPFKFSAQLDGRVMLFTACASIVSTFVFGFAPALISTRQDLVSVLKATDAVTLKTGKPWGRNLLVAGQMALSLVLLVVSAVLVQGFRADLLRGPGFRTDHLFVMSLNPSLLRYSDAQTEQFYKQLLDKARLAPDVKSAALASAVPIAIGASQIGVVPEGFQLERGQEAITTFDSVVSEGYFHTMGISIVQGRGFVESDQVNTPARGRECAIRPSLLAGSESPGKKVSLAELDGRVDRNRRSHEDNEVSFHQRRAARFCLFALLSESAAPNDFDHRSEIAGSNRPCSRIAPGRPGDRSGHGRVRRPQHAGYL